MVFRRRREPEVPPPPAPLTGELVALRTRAHAAAGLIARSAPDTLAAATATRVAAELDGAAASLAELRERLALLDPDRTTAELKEARRRRDAAPEGPERTRLEAVVDAAERRFSSVHRLWDRTEAIGQEAELVVARLEELAASVAVPGSGAVTGADARLEDLQREVEALAATYRELGY